MNQDSNNHDDRTLSYVVLTKGTMVLHYRIVEKIGAGSMGEVYLVVDTPAASKRSAAMEPESDLI